MQPILREFPFAFESARLLIRGAQAGDGQVVQTAVSESVNELRQWMPWAMGDVPTVKAYEVMMRQWHVDFLARKVMNFLLFARENGRLVGVSGLMVRNWDVPYFEIGYWARTPESGKGYMTEAVAAITDFAFTQLEARRVEIRCDAQNGRSAAIPQRLGFALEATLHAEARHHLTNELRDTLIFAKTQPDEPS